MCVGLLVFLSNEGSEFVFFKMDGQEFRHEVIVCRFNNDRFGPVCGEQYIKGIPIGFLGVGEPIEPCFCFPAWVKELGELVNLPLDSGCFIEHSFEFAEPNMRLFTAGVVATEKLEVLGLGSHDSGFSCWL